jgi:hypothetical protein
MLQVAHERRADLVLVSEQHRNLERDWLPDITSRSAVFSPGCRIGRHDAGDGWAWVETRGVRVYSCYFSPNRPLSEFAAFLDGLTASVETRTGPVIVAGDLNAKAADWGSSITNRRGEMLCGAMAQLRLHPANVGTEPTFRRGKSESIIDVTFTDEDTAGWLLDWRVLNIYSHSDHQYIGYRLSRRPTSERPQPWRTAGWSTKKFDVSALLEVMAQGSQSVMAPGKPATLRCREGSREGNDRNRSTGGQMK